ncbi:NBAS subunit of NRZ tethering complex [Amyelois transitella]|uniref:NBAS subunit of NRZ tethering complex n=1 Tax=Amyelois transitella TaxID=680683 RepID=UPI00298FDE28|nr:NBAS subunit of NRZ tethering complex [Amyelois transitella]
MEESMKSILHELYVYCEWKPEPEYIQKPDGILPENLSALWRWLNFFGPKKSLIDSISAHIDRQQKWHIALGDEGKVIAILTDNILEIRTKRSEYATIAARTTVNRDPYPQWRKLVWSPDCLFLVLAYGNGMISFFDLSATVLFNIPIDCSKPGGLECTDNTHAVVDIIFTPLHVRDTKWNWEVIVVTYDGNIRGYVVSQTEGCKLRHTFPAPGGASAVAYCPHFSMLLHAGVPRAGKDLSSPLSYGITAWRLLNDDPYYKLSVVSDQFEAQLAKEPFQLYIPFVTNKNLAYVVRIVISPDSSKMVCLHCNGDVSIWRLPLLSLLYRHPLSSQPQHDLLSPLHKAPPAGKLHEASFYAADVNWWSNEELIVSRFSGAVSICNIADMVNILGKKPEFFQGAPKVTRAQDGAFMALECESNVLPARKSRSDESLEVVKVESEQEESTYEAVKELIKWVLYGITDMETFQPRPKTITVMSRVYRLLALKSTTPEELFSRKIESGNYTEALALAEAFNLDSDLVYQQQWRRTPVSSEAIEKYLSKVSHKIWAVHQCVDRLPETLPAAKQLLQFGLTLTNERILDEINKDRDENTLKDPDDITLEDLNAYTSELLRCRHVMLFYKERLRLYEAILRCEKSTYVKDEYDRLRSNSIVHTSMEIAKEGRIEALTCLWPNIKTIPMQLAVLEKLPETINPLDYQHLLPTKQPLQWFEKKSPIKIKPAEHENDWCRKEIFRSIWNSNWSEDTTPETETASDMPDASEDFAIWYTKRAKEIEQRSGLASHALTLVTIATVGGAVPGLDTLMFHLLTLDTLIYDINVEGVTLADIESMSILETCTMLMKMSTPATFVADLKQFVIPFLKRYENLTKRAESCINGLTDYLESVSVDDLSSILLVLQSPSEFELDVRTHLELAERCLLAHTSTAQLSAACDLLDTILKETDGSISSSELVRRVGELERLVAACGRLARRGLRVPLAALRATAREHHDAAQLLTRLARSRAKGDEKPTPQDWAELLKDILELQSTLLTCVTKEECYEIYASSLLTSGDANSIRLAADVLTCSTDNREPRRNGPQVPYERSVQLATAASKEYFNSASSLSDPALELAKCCLSLIKDGNAEIEEELDLIAALQILNSFELTLLPIQVRLCEDRMSLIEDCLKADSNAYLASHKLLKLAKLLKIAGDDEQTREGQVLVLVGEYALQAGRAGRGAAADAAHRLAALRYAPAADLMARVAARGGTDRASIRKLLAASAAHAPPEAIEFVLRGRLELELEGLYQMGAALKEQGRLEDHRWPSTDDDFADAITTPIIEKKDLVAPDEPEKKPLFNYLLDTFQSKFYQSENKSSSPDQTERSVHVQEFYRSLYPSHDVSTSYYGYDRFSIPDSGDASSGHAALKWYYIQNCLEDGEYAQDEIEVVQKCAEELLYKDTPLSIACLLRSAQTPAAMSALVTSQQPAAAALYAALVRCNAPELRDYVYLARPAEMARTTLKEKNASEEQMEVIKQCIARLSGMGEVDRLRRLGFQVNGLLYNADEDYRNEMIYRVARSTEPEHIRTARALGTKYGLDEVELWLQHAAASAQGSPPFADLAADVLPTSRPDAHTRIKDTLWPLIRGNDHSALISFFSVLRSVDEKPLIYGLTAADHIKLLKKAKAASTELDYKMLMEQSPSLADHLVDIMRVETVGMLGKFLRALPAAVATPLPPNQLYAKWLTRHLFSVPEGASNKKWMQQYRQCASYFNKLSKADLLCFLRKACFSQEAIERIPASTRNLMLLQAVDYCQQEHDHEIKVSKSEPTWWSQVGQEVSLWARFLENFHSPPVQNIIDSSDVPRSIVWPDIEMSSGDRSRLSLEIGHLLLSSPGGVRRTVLTALLNCLHADFPVEYVFERLAETVDDPHELQILVDRMIQYHKEGAKFPVDLLERISAKAASADLPAGAQLALLALRPRDPRRAPAPAPPALAAFSAGVLRAQWPGLELVRDLTDDMLMTEEGRRSAVAACSASATSWQQKKALIELLSCWPHQPDSNGKSIQYEHLESLLKNPAEQKQNLVLIKLLLTSPVLTDEEVKSLSEKATSDSIINVLWIILLNKGDNMQEMVLNLLQQHKDKKQKQEMDDELIKELLDSGMFMKLVSTPVYCSIISYIITHAGDPEPNPYTVEWATSQLLNANYLAEAGHLNLLSIGVPSALRGFTQSILYCKNMLQN